MVMLICLVGQGLPRWSLTYFSPLCTHSLSHHIPLNIHPAFFAALERSEPPQIIDLCNRDSFYVRYNLILKGPIFNP